MWVRGADLALLAVVIIVWTGRPVYNLLFIAFNEDDEQFTEFLRPEEFTFDNFWPVVTQDHWYLTRFWWQLGNSFYIGILTMMLTLGIGAAVSFAIGRGRLRHRWLFSNAALLTYVVPSSLC